MVAGALDAVHIAMTSWRIDDHAEAGVDEINHIAKRASVRRFIAV
jgi:hypothetical protein